MARNCKCCGCKYYQILPKILGLLVWLRQYLQNQSFPLQHLLPHQTWCHCCIIRCSWQVRRVPQKYYNQSSRIHGRSRVYLQDHPIGWKTRYPLQVRWQIPADNKAYGGRLLMSRPSIYSSTRGTNHSSTALLQSDTTIQWCACTYHWLGRHHCLLLYSVRWWIHQTPICH